MSPSPSGLGSLMKELDSALSGCMATSHSQLVRVSKETSAAGDYSPCACSLACCVSLHSLVMEHSLSGMCWGWGCLWQSTVASLKMDHRYWLGTVQARCPGAQDLLRNSLDFFKKINVPSEFICLLCAAFLLTTAFVSFFSRFELIHYIWIRHRQWQMPPCSLEN